jgi:hypothetical protein
MILIQPIGVDSHGKSRAFCRARARRKGLGDFRPENMARKDTEADGSNVRWGSKSGAAETAKVAVCGYKKQVPR